MNLDLDFHLACPSYKYLIFSFRSTGHVVCVEKGPEAKQFSYEVHEREQNENSGIIGYILIFISHFPNTENINPMSSLIVLEHFF